MSAAEPSALPRGLRQDWPVPHLDVLGPRGGVLAWIECFALRALVGGVGRLPRPLRSAFVGALARVASVVDRSHTRAAEEFLRQALGPELTKRELSARVRQSWRHLIDLTLDTELFASRVPHERVREHFEVELGPDVQALLAAHEGCVLVGAHVGDWEAAPAILPSLGFDPLYTISKPPKNRWLSLHAQRVRESRGMRLLPRRGAMQHAPAIVRAGGTVAMLLDQRARVKPVLAPFFGRLARCDRSAGVLMRRLRAPLVFAACYRAARPFHYRFVAKRVVRPEEFAGKSPAEIAELVNGELERLILAAPEQYFWLHDRYRGTSDPRTTDSSEAAEGSSAGAEEAEDS